MDVATLATEIKSAAAIIDAAPDNPDVLRVIVMPHVRRLAVLCAEAMAADEAETRDAVRQIVDAIFQPLDNDGGDAQCSPN